MAIMTVKMELNHSYFIIAVIANKYQAFFSPVQRMLITAL